MHDNAAAAGTLDNVIVPGPDVAEADAARHVGLALEDVLGHRNDADRGHSFSPR